MRGKSLTLPTRQLNYSRGLRPAEVIDPEKRRGGSASRRLAAHHGVKDRDELEFSMFRKTVGGDE
jgi:hypothetical protein